MYKNKVSDFAIKIHCISCGSFLGNWKKGHQKTTLKIVSKKKLDEKTMFDPQTYQKIIDDEVYQKKDAIH